jgi:hypothetical protein
MRQSAKEQVEKPSDAYREVALVQNDMARKAHQELFSFDDGRYIVSGNDIRESIASLAVQGVDKMHIAADWEHVLRVALWRSSIPPVFEVIHLLKRLGAAEPELAPFRTCDINDLFPWLYYGKKFDVLRKLCNAAKARAEAGAGRAHLQVICHLVAEDPLRIVASSL